ncbi:BTAD domain-containing putative transcriptional regulator [soil metagenome]
MSKMRGNTFGERLRNLRESAGLTQEELAAKAGMTAKGVSAIERGERKRPYPHTVRSLAEALELTDEKRAALLDAMPSRHQRNSDPAPIAASAPETLASNLPAPTTPFLGRERELKEIGNLLARSETRLLTLTGVGGMGKTRLALEAARQMEKNLPDGVAFVALAPLGDAALVAPTIAQSLGLKDTARLAPLDTIRDFLRGKKMLLVLDNFEHVLQATPDVAALIEGCPDLKILVTSRASLRIRSEQEYPVPPLGLPPSTVSTNPEDVLSSSSGYLFVERAQAASPAFTVTGENAGAVAAICWRLDGLPLALELAAARARFLDPASLLERLDRALSGGWARDLPERQRTMRAALDWSYDLLSEEEKALFRRLSVFAGGFTLEAAEEVGTAQIDHEADDVLDLLGRLVEQSLVLAEASAGEMRYRMLEPVRQYAMERLNESDEERDRAVGRHKEHYLALAERAESGIKGWDQVSWLDRLEAENDNLRAVIGRSVEAGDIETASRVGWDIVMYWVMRARHSEGRRLMEQALDRAADAPTGMRARMSWALSVCIYGSGENERLRDISEEGIGLARQAGDEHAEANLVGIAGFAALQLGDLERATRLLEESLELCQRLGLEWNTAQILTHLSVPYTTQGDLERGAAYAREALEITQRIGDRLAGEMSLYILAQAAWTAGDGEEASRYFRRSLAVGHEFRDVVNSAYGIIAVAVVERGRDEPRRTARMLGAAEAMLERVGVPLYAQVDDQFHLDAERTAREELGEEAWTTAWNEGRSMDLDQAVAYALEDG